VDRRWDQAIVYGSSTRSVLLPALTALAAAAYFSLNGWFTLEWADEGQLVYLSWRVAEGAFPFRDFSHIYGPSMFLVNGAVLKLFGPQLAVLRILIVAVKTLSVVMVYSFSRRAASRPLALGAAVLLAAVWGTPWPFFTTPYAGEYALALGLLGALIFLGGEEHPRLACLVAGLCCGVAATFKQTTGLFLFLALLVVLLAQRPVAPPRRQYPILQLAAAWVRPLGQGVVLAFALLYPLAGGGVLHALILGAPLTALQLRVLVRELRDPPTAAARTESASRVLAASLGAVAPLALCALAFAGAGALPRLVADTVVSLPAAIEYFSPPAFHAPSLLVLGLLLASLAAARSGAERRGFSWELLAVALSALALGVVVAGSRLGPGWGWRPLLIGGVLFVPFLAAWSAPLLAGRRDGKIGEASLMAGALAATGLLNLHPIADEWHAYLVLPVFLPAAAASLLPLIPSRRPGGTASRAVALAVLALTVGLLAWPFGRATHRVHAGSPLPLETVERARGIRLAPREHREATELVHHLEAPERRNRAVFVPTGQAMVYFLSQRTSPLEEIEFLLYLIGFGLLSEEEARSRIDTDAVVATLESTRPLLVEDAERSARLRSTLPRLGEYLDAHYRITRRIGRFHVLDRADGSRDGP
jgi:hypothetical protein